jgi:rhodanese-related sulfurtransferase
MRRDSLWRDTVAIVALAGVAAAVSNAVAGPERKLRWIGSYTASAPSPARTPAPGPAGPPGPAAAVTPAAPEGAGKAFAPHPNTAWVEISGNDVAALHARGDILFLDARRTSVYRARHIAGARSIAIWEADADDKVKALFAEGRDQSAPIVIYCSGGECEDSHMLGQKLYFVGFDNVLVYKDGLPDWEKRGLPVGKGDAP